MKTTLSLHRLGMVAAMFSVLSCDSGPMEVQWSDGLKMLFIGNSITYSHDLPSIVGALVDSAGIEADTIVALTRGGWTLADHWALGIAQKQIAGGAWDVVVLQGYTGLGESRDSLLKYAELFAAEASLAGSRTALFMRNPGVSYREHIDEMAAAFAHVAKQTNAILLPAGVAWGEVWKRDPTFNLYDDDVHPNEAGSYLTALVIFQHLTGKSPVALPATLTLSLGWYPEQFEIPPDDAEFLQEAAAAVGVRYGFD